MTTHGLWLYNPNHVMKHTQIPFVIWLLSGKTCVSISNTKEERKASNSNGWFKVTVVTEAELGNPIRFTYSWLNVSCKESHCPQVTEIHFIRTGEWESMPQKKEWRHIFQRTVRLVSEQEKHSFKNAENFWVFCGGEKSSYYADIRNFSYCF